MGSENGAHNPHYEKDELSSQLKLAHCPLKRAECINFAKKNKKKKKFVSDRLHPSKRGKAFQWRPEPRVNCALGHGMSQISRLLGKLKVKKDSIQLKLGF